MIKKLLKSHFRSASDTTPLGRKGVCIMFRSVTYSSADMYCRYLDASISHGYCSGVCGGRFGNYLNDRFALEKLPYDIKIFKIITTGALSPDLFVRLPESFFRNWANFPMCPASWLEEKSEVEEAASNNNIYYFPSSELTLNKLLHPYDSEPLNREFVQRFDSKIPRYLKVIKLAEYRRFLPFEAYFAYWRGYVLVDALTGYLDIDQFLSEKQGVAKLIKRISVVNDDWNQKYKGIFQRLSLYRTSMSVINSRHSKCELTYKQISDFLLGMAKTNGEVLESDLEQLLILYDRWQYEIEKNGRIHLSKALELLKLDIYFLFQWLCISTDLEEEHYFKKWSYEFLRTAEWAPLKEIIAYEEFDLQKTFIRFMKFYCEEIEVFGFADNLDKIYSRLCEISSFAPWVRSFSDMHKSINNTAIIYFRQPRILDYLIVITTRTEIVIRDMYLKYLSKEDTPSKILHVLKELAMAIKDKKRAKVLEALGNDWDKTMLNDKPEDMFATINSIENKKGWNEEMMCFYKQILKFVTSRNYFAHHSYKDEAINTSQSNVTSDVLKACVQSLIFLDSLLQEVH